MKKKQTDSPGRGRRERVEQLLELRTAALEAADNAVLITDREATIVWANSAGFYKRGCQEKTLFP